MSAPKRIQLRRTKGWRKPEGVIVVARPSIYGNPFPLTGDWIMWTAVALGLHAGPAGRRRAAVALHRAWLTDSPLRLREFDPVAGTEHDGVGLEFGDGTVVSLADQAAGIATFGMRLATPPVLPERPSLEGLRGHDLACWCGLDDMCHGDTLLELANR